MIYKLELPLSLGKVVLRDSVTFSESIEHPILSVGSSYSSLLPEVYDWLIEHCGMNWEFRIDQESGNYCLFFKSEFDIRFFKIKWLNDDSYKIRIDNLAKSAGWITSDSFRTYNAIYQYQNFDKDKFVELIVKDCLHIIQRSMIRDGDTPENIRSRHHLYDIAEKYNIIFPI